MTSEAERRVRQLYAAMRERARAADGLRVDRAGSYVAEPVFYAKYDEGLLLRMQRPGGEACAVTVAKTLRSVRVSVGGERSRPLGLDLREGYRWEGVDYETADELARELMDRLVARSEPDPVPEVGRADHRLGAPAG